MEKGTVFWITGLSGAGKTTIGKQLLTEMRKNKKNVVLLDGDELRKTIAEDAGYEREDRIKAGYRYCKIANLLANQGIDVIVATVAMFHCLREWNRDNIDNYREVYLRVSNEVLMKRNQKKLYSGVKEGKVKNVMGVDMKIEEPKKPDLVIQNDGRYTIQQCVDMIKNIC